MCNRDLDVLDMRHQYLSFRRQPGIAEIALQAFFQITRFTHVQNLAVGVVHTVNAGLAGDGFEEGF